MVRNALRMCPDWVRKRIRVVAIAPAAYIDDYLCHSVVHYVSDGDIVHRIDAEGRERCKHTTRVLERHKDARGLVDHAFLSPTFQPAIYHETHSYLKKAHTWL